MYIKYIKNPEFETFKPLVMYGSSVLWLAQIEQFVGLGLCAFSRKNVPLLL